MHNAQAASSTNSSNTLRERVTPFPFLTIRLVLGTSFDAAHGYQARLVYLSFNDDLGQRGNKGGITVSMLLSKKIRATVWSTSNGNTKGEMKIRMALEVRKK